MISKICSKCSVDKPIDAFAIDKRRMHMPSKGIQTACKACESKRTSLWSKKNPEKTAAYGKKYYDANPDKMAAKTKAYRAANEEKVKATNKVWRDNNKEKLAFDFKNWVARNKEYVAKKEREYRQARKEHTSDVQREYRKNNASYFADATAKRRASKLQRTPEWLTQEHHDQIAAKYEERERITQETGIEHHVDHILPLQGKNVSGLHVPWNLQVIPAEDNLRKSNSA